MYAHGPKAALLHSQKQNFLVIEFLIFQQLYLLTCLFHNASILLQLITWVVCLSKTISSHKLNHSHYRLGNSRKYPYLYHGRLFGILRARGGVSLTWNSEGMGVFQIWDFQRGQTRVCSLKTLIFGLH